jgi:hypothetical protein
MVGGTDDPRDGSRFLRDTFTGVAWYDRLTLLRQEDNERDPNDEPVISGWTDVE